MVMEIILCTSVYYVSGNISASSMFMLNMPERPPILLPCYKCLILHFHFETVELLFGNFLRMICRESCHGDWRMNLSVKESWLLSTSTFSSPVAMYLGESVLPAILNDSCLYEFCFSILRETLRKTLRNWAFWKDIHKVSFQSSHLHTKSKLDFFF